MMDEGRAWGLIKLVFWGTLIFIILKLGFSLFLMKTEPQHPDLGTQLSTLLVSGSC